MEPIATSIKDLLIESGKIDPEGLPSPEMFSGGSFENLGKRLVELGVISEEDLLEILSGKLNVPLISLKNFTPGDSLLAENLSEKFMRHGKFVPLSVTDGTLSIAICDPFDVYTLDAIRQATGYRLDVKLARESEILDLIDKVSSADASSMEKIIEDIGKDDRGELGSEEDGDVDHLKDMASEAPVIRLVNLVISRAIELRASDIHFEPFEGSFTVRYRIDGILHDVESPPRRLQAAVISRIKIMSKLNIAERRLPQDGRIKLRVLGKEIDFRVSTTPTMFGESVVLRILDRESVVLDLEKLGFPPDSLKTFRGLIAQPYGIILVTGPTGSGKTTTLYGALSEINSPEKKIITVEDPVEYQLKGINQMQVKPAIGLTFASSLRSILRQDPDIIMIGEIRDAETAEIAIHSALTGHLVFSTLHTNDAAGAVTRLLEMGMENYLISSSLIGILAQRLVRVICSHCGEPHEPEVKALKDMGLDLDDLTDAQIVEGKGCEKCASTGYRGRTGIYELLPVTDEIRELILARADSNRIKEQGRKLGMNTLREAGWKRVRQGTTTISELIRVTQVES
jgi:general secretion pathway protein E